MSFVGEERDLLRFLTAGSVDDGKSTLIGRLLYESNGIYEDQLSSVKKASSAKNMELDLSLLTDGLRAEREQGITIDVAYRYFASPRRKFIIADAPGHEQYTRNMATGASTAEVALILVDARKGLLVQTRRHTLISWLLGIRRLIVVINKMDLVDYDDKIFRSIRDEFTRFAASLPGVEIEFVPLSALNGENVIRCNGSIPWYQGPTLLNLLETIPAKPEPEQNFRFAVQNVIRPDQDFRGYAGQVGSGIVKPGQAVIALPSGQRTTIQDIFLYDRKLEKAFPPQSVVLTTTDHIDLGRGDMLVSPDHLPTVTTRVTANLIWMSQTPLRRDMRYLIKHTTKVLCGRIGRLNHKFDVNTMDRVAADSLQFNEIGEVQLELHNPIFCDPYQRSRSTGSFIVIDPLSNDTVAAGMIVEATALQASDGLDESSAGSRVAQQQGLTVWFTGLSGAGKTTVCRAVATELLAHGLQVEVIDGDIIRNHLCKDLGFSKQDRDENIRRIAFVSKLLTRNGAIVLVSAISPYRESRDAARRTIGNFMEVYVSTPLAVCEVRDPKDLYKKARSGKIHGFTGIDDPYEPPVAPEIVCNTDQESTRESSSKVVAAVLKFLSSTTP
ncbi:MAG TPA: sulfate adenylyltransferase subunit CysN [Candidatus Eisenbacteria bacterium]|nr:sulfate adenylyltransferase subunit CysN [Candidatus Eisenbacteria bacterium]